MTIAVTTRVINIGNSGGIRIPKLLLDQLGQVDEGELLVERAELIVRPVRHLRTGWEAQFKLMVERGDDHLLDPDFSNSTRWDVEEWSWS